MVERRHGYKFSKVNGTEFTIKERYEGTKLSSLGRRLAINPSVAAVVVEYDGTIELRMRGDDSFTFGYSSVKEMDNLPGEFDIERVHIHSTEGANASVVIDPKL